jgi:hypothetical protein
MLKCGEGLKSNCFIPYRQLKQRNYFHDVLISETNSIT